MSGYRHHHYLLGYYALWQFDGTRTAIFLGARVDHSANYGILGEAQVAISKGPS